MQRITFTPVGGGTTTINDVNSSTRPDGTYLPVHLVGFEPNSVAGNIETYERTGQSGAGVYGTKLAVRNIQVKLAFVPVHQNSENNMYALRREILAAFPLNVQGTLKYYNGGDTYEIECMLCEYPGTERIVGNLCEITFYLTAHCPFWRRKAADIELSASADSTATKVFTANTEFKTPVCAMVACTDIIGTPTDTDDQIIEIEISGWENDECFSHVDENGTAYYTRRPRTGKMYISHRMNTGDEILIDWGLMNRFYFRASDSGNKYEYIDFINSNGLYIYPGENTLSVKISAESGSLNTRLILYDYVRAV